MVWLWNMWMYICKHAKVQELGTRMVFTLEMDVVKKLMLRSLWNENLYMILQLYILKCFSTNALLILLMHAIIENCEMREYHRLKGIW